MHAGTIMNYGEIMSQVTGTAGYERFASRFVESSQSMDFRVVCQAFIDYLPEFPARILDVGAGAGQNAAALADMGYNVTAIEPLDIFLTAAQTAYSDQAINWHQCQMPGLACLDGKEASFDFILAEGVWHHLDETERQSTVLRFGELLRPGGRCALSLRNGPMGMGSCVYPTDADETIAQFLRAGFKCMMHLEHFPGLIQGKENIIWSRVVLEKL
ncbi:class I SAM-dependent methyltransferase [Oceanospirillum sediminis]|uniref:Class I SAM-dependent methyltransferase n=1 Tax=Oceanospirillum sediminis TaxID=2760088 RepID=A0A839ISL0_9GAMM|nr:class I SAM-dependent methyltransferase [Oceanospirillum sediminis]MBB1487660.1 class I SAM-dependent methyltransferase [Oceanospirillum sediminis]